MQPFKLCLFKMFQACVASAEIAGNVRTGGVEVGVEGARDVLEWK